MATLNDLKKLAKDLGIKGYSSMKKNDLQEAIDAKYREMDGPKRMSNGRRTGIYLRQNDGKISPRQARRIRKNANKLKG